MSDQQFENEMVRQIIAAMRQGDKAGAVRLADHLLMESVDPHATEARIQQAIRDAS
ncbi:MAG: hypothetical protein HOY69_24665 [Streptomyces sp.]|nr:hypothetical protein [Streptomyces sp.]